MLKSTYKPATQAPSLPSGWTEHKSPTGHSYYYNVATKESTYSRPTELTQPPLATSSFTGGNYLSPHPPEELNIRKPDKASMTISKLDHTHQYGSMHGRSDSEGKYHGKREHVPQDRPKSKHPIPGYSSWFLVKTRLGRRFVYNSENKESFWKFPLDVMKGVVEYDRLEREKRHSSQLQAPDSKENVTTAAPRLLSGPSELSDQSRAVIREENSLHSDNNNSEYEEVEVTENEDDQNPPKRQKTEDEDGDQPVEFNEDDIAYQLAAMGEDHGLDPGEYGHEIEGLEEGAEGLALSEEDACALFKDMLDDYHISPYSMWEKVIEAGEIVEDDRYTVLPNMKSRKEVWSEWSRIKIQSLKEQRNQEEKVDPQIAYFAFLELRATPKLFWPEFRRKFKKEPEFRDVQLTDKEREKAYRDYINRLKLPERILKSDLVALLKSISLQKLNRSTPLNGLPPVILTDVRYISLRPSVRDPLIETYISTLPLPPDDLDASIEGLEALRKRKEERERRERAMADRQKLVQEEKRKQKGALQISKGMLREGEEQIERARKIGKEGLRAYMELDT